ncbi:penicillin-binding protein 2 [Sphaerobacter thermophilus]|uniref:penicillin-binding protein 2 n=1 Tax=Sphaerobacter thermophilus TaxID=2057 RepID=UPI00396D6A05
MPKLVMSVLGLVVIVLGLFLLADRLGGRLLGNTALPDASPVASPSPGSVEALRTPRDVAAAFTRLWNAGDYAGMYELLSAPAKHTISREDFIARYEGIAQEIGQTAIEATLLDADRDALEQPMHVKRESAKVGTLEEDNVIPIVEEEDGFRVDWTPSVIFAELGDGFVRWQPDIPQRGRILDRKGRPLAHLGQINKVGVVPGQIQDEAALLQALSQALGMPEDEIKSRYEHGQPDWFMPIKSYPDPMDPGLLEQLAGIPGVVVQKWPERVYPAGEAAAHVVGYLTEITADELPELSARGYSAGDVIGRAGIEAWGEQYLAGKRGGRLVIVGPDGGERRVIAEVQSEPAADIVTTIDLDVQLAAERALGDNTGSVVVIDPNTGAILAMVSNPSFDPNKFILGLSDEDWARFNDEEARPLQNRATTFAYPSGSTFKVVTAAAGMIHLGMNMQSTLDCPAAFSLPGSSNVWRDWTGVDQGPMTLHRALVRSCNTFFYQVGVQLDEKDPNLLAETARAFGFGNPTGLEELPEVAGIVPDPAWKLAAVRDGWARGDAVNFAIGQGYFLATPLQVANAYAALANGGTLWQPYLVQEVVALDGTKVYTHEPKEIGKLPISQEQIAGIRAALVDVVTTPAGTAYSAFQGETHPVAAKTGTAEHGQEGRATHAWFAAFSPVDGARLAAVTMIEYGGEGAIVSAPVTREVINAFYEANP